MKGTAEKRARGSIYGGWEEEEGKEVRAGLEGATEAGQETQSCTGEERLCPIGPDPATDRASGPRSALLSLTLSLTILSPFPPPASHTHTLPPCVPHRFVSHSHPQTPPLSVPHSISERRSSLVTPNRP